MALGQRRDERQQELWVATTDLPESVGHAFYAKLNELLVEAGFDRWIEAECEPHYSRGTGRPGIPPGTYFRMLLVGYFEGIQSQRGIAWRCADSLSIRKFLGIALTESTPDHSSLTKIRDRLPLSLHEAAFQWALRVAVARNLVRGSSVAIDSSTLEAAAAMKSIVRRENGQDWKEYLTGLMQAEGLVPAGTKPSAEAIRNFDKKRKNKKVSNDEWKSRTDPDARITHMKDGTTHLAYKAEHVVDLDSGIVLAAEVHAGDAADSFTMEDSLNQGQANLIDAGIEHDTIEVAADKGYHSTEQLSTLREQTNYRTYIPEPNLPYRRNWTKRTADERAAVEANRRRMRTEKGKRLQRLRSEKVERTFAHMLETGGARRTHLRGTAKVKKRYLITAAAHNIGVIMRLIFGIGTARSLQGFGRALWAHFWGYLRLKMHLTSLWRELILNFHFATTPRRSAW